jgi:hypothetical protein
MWQTLTRILVDAPYGKQGLLCALSVLALVPFGAGCASKARAAAVAQGPPLAVPAPPQRVLVPVQDVAPPVEEPVAEQPLPPPPPQPKQEPPRARPRPENESRAEAPSPAPANPGPTEKPTLQIAPSPGESAATEVQVQNVLNQVARALKQVTESRLNKDQKETLTEARRNEQRAKTFLAERNYPAAQAAADKALQLVTALPR